jgi:hypothetical protein
VSPSLLATCALIGLSCGGTTTGSSSDAGLDVRVSRDAVAESSADGGACYMLSIPASWRACSSSAQCGVGITLVDFCGSQDAVGINRSSFAQFQRAENAMTHHCVFGACPAGPTTADDGTMSTFGGTPTVTCKGAVGGGEGVCTTSFAEAGTADAGARDAASG